VAPRPNWKGFLKLSLVSCAVALYSATSTSQRIRFNIINRKTGNRIRNDVVDAETGQPVEPEDRVKGYEVEKGEYVLVEEDELDNMALESTHTIDIEEFVPVAEVDRIYLDESYYIVPQDDVAEEAFAVIRDAIRHKDMVGLGRVVLARREHVVLLEAFDKGLLATTVRYAYEVRDQAAYFEDIPELKLPAEMKQLAGHIIETKSDHFDPKKFEDHYENALVELLRQKQAGRAIEPVKDEGAQPQRVINLMDALRASIGAQTQKKPAAPSAKARAGAAAAGAKRKTGR